ncbi:LPS translocon maturation chaperone LptM [Thalassotalea euphylliae]|nr:lipoprotein [Thalassotalea euphylliae]
MKTKLNRICACFFVLCLLAGCGLKAPLYQTPEQPEQEQPVSDAGEN